MTLLFVLGTYAVPWNIVGRSMYNAVMTFDSYLASLTAAERFVNCIIGVNIGEDITQHLVHTFKSYLQPVAERNLPSPVPCETYCHEQEFMEVDEGVPGRRQLASIEKMSISTSK